jgi:hypothetical protein
MERADELSLGDNARERLQALLAAVRNADQHYELMLYIERFFAIQVEVRQYFSLIEREIIDKLREFREIEEIEMPPARATQPTNLFVPRDQGEGRR